jgi:MoxR-like ATPase
MDRFLLRIRVGYPDETHERRSSAGRNAAWATSSPFWTTRPYCLPARRTRSRWRRVSGVCHGDRAGDRTHGAGAGVSPRALALVRPEAMALTDGRYCVPDDIRILPSRHSPPCLPGTRWGSRQAACRHRTKLPGVLRTSRFPMSRVARRG